MNHRRDAEYAEVFVLRKKINLSAVSAPRAKRAVKIFKKPLHPHNKSQDLSISGIVRYNSKNAKK
jgi:ribosomal protein L31E